MNRSPRLLALLGSASVLAVLLATLAVLRPGVEKQGSTYDCLPLSAASAARESLGRASSGAELSSVRSAPLPGLAALASPQPLSSAAALRRFERAFDLSSLTGATTFAALTPKQQKKVDKLDAKLLAKQLALVELEAQLDDAEVALSTSVIALSFAQSLLDDAEAELAAALELPASTAQEIAARNLAVKAAKLALKSAKKSFKAAKKANKKATKTEAKLNKKIAKNEAKQSSLATALEELDPGHFSQPNSGPLLAALANANQVVLTFSDIDDAESYQLFWSTASGVSPETGNLVDDVSSPHVINGLPEGFTLHAVVAAVVGGEVGAPSNPIEVTTSAEGDSDGQVEPDDDDPDGEEPGGGGGGDPEVSPYDPDWADIAPLNTIALNYDSGASATANGTALKNAVSSLQAGDMLVVGAGTWSIPSKFSPVFHGTAQAPVWVVAADGAKPILTRPDASQNVMNPEGDYGVWRGFEITGGSAGMRIGASSNLWIDDNEIHDTPENAITANTADTDHLYITRNHIHHISVGTGGTGEGMYLGANNSVHVMSESVIALNHVHDTEGSQGDGIEVKQGSWGNWIVENDVHDTRFPAIIAYGTDGNAVNLIERNRLRGDTNQVLQVQGEALVRNNLIMGGSTGFQSHDHQGNTRDLVFVHNTIVTKDKGAHLADWGGRAGMVFANNVVYSEDNQSVTFGSGSNGVAWAGNVLHGSTSGAPGSGAITGNGLSDFVDMAWDGSDQDATPVAGSPILGAGSATHAVSDDFSGEARSGALESGAIDVE